MCKKLKWRAKEEEMEIDALILPLGEFNVILGMQWLESLGKMVWNFDERKMQFSVDNKEMELQVMPKPTISWMSKEHLLSIAAKEDSESRNQYFMV